MNTTAVLLDLLKVNPNRSNKNRVEEINFCFVQLPSLSSMMIMMKWHVIDKEHEKRHTNREPGKQKAGRQPGSRQASR